MLLPPDLRFVVNSEANLQAANNKHGELAEFCNMRGSESVNIIVK
jgi:hypothetical protein